MKTMRILYLSVHEVLEYDELKIFTELGHECFSHGAYCRPHIGSSLRPPIPEMSFDPHFADLVDRFPKNNLPPELIEDKDIIIIMHTPSLVIDNWEKIKHKRVIWRSIGQSVPEVERMLLPYREQGLEIVRYSPREKMIPNYIGADAVIRFYKDPKEYDGWVGNNRQIMALNQSMKQRWLECNYPIFHHACKGYPVKLFGPDNEGLPENSGILTYEQIKQEMRENRAFFYTGTRVTSYTLGFIEAFMTGIPIVSVGETQGNHPSFEQRTFEIHEIIENGKEGFVSDNVLELRIYLNELLNDHEFAKGISENARKKAIRLFGKENIKEQWKRYLDKG
ncbi:glycosyltransferase [Bacillus methanolicus]|uniref:glycosyltransferase n=1 Tax=Bacillus methanolicus TaxID=1471 RepID=UPI000A9DC2A3|nr:glycosyltransferase [Bacillus methanolicus]